MRLLALDTATDLCSAALWVDGVVSVRESVAPRLHGALLLAMVDGLLAEAAVSVRQLDAIAFGRGPGAFTGVRLAAATAQGLGFATQRPLIPISDLRALAAQALASPTHTDLRADAAPAPRPLSAAGGAGRVLICQDARMGEVYWGCFERACEGAPLRLVGAEHVSAPSAVAPPPEWQTPVQAPALICASGSGFAVYESLRTNLAGRLGVLMPDLYPRAREIAALAAEDGPGAALSPDQALPVYLRDRVTDVAPRAAN